MKYKDVLTFARDLRKNQTPAEQFFWSKVRNRRFFGMKMNRQFIIEYAEIQGQQKFYIVDFYCHEKRLIIELDGSVHLTQEEYDKRREERLRGMGFKIIRFKNEAVLENWSSVEDSLYKLLV